jgi:alpha-amylase
MKAISLNLEIHQPMRLKRYRFFDIGNDHYYYDDFLNDDIVSDIARRSYVPAAETLLEMVKANPGKFKFSIAITGVAIEQFETYVPEMNDLLKKLADTGDVEFLATPYAHSLASLTDPEEFISQVRVHAEKIKALYGAEASVLQNAELIYSDDIAPVIASMGYKGVITEGAKHILGWKSPNYIYSAATEPKLKLMLRNSKLSDDIAFRFSDTQWDAYPLTADKYIDWVASAPEEEQITCLCMNLDAFGGMQPASSGILQFLQALPRFAQERGISFVKASEAIAKFKSVGTLQVPFPISSADEARDTSAWLGNKMQHEAFEKLYSVAERVRLCQDRRLKQDWWYLQASDHFYYMSTKHMADGIVHSMFSPYETPFEAFTNYMNVLADFIVRVEEQYPMEIGNEELNSLLTTIRNQAREIETLKKELTSLRKNIEQYNVEHALRTPAKEAAPKITPAKTKRTCKPRAKKSE